MNAHDAARASLEVNAQPAYLALCDRAVEAGCRWVWDPEHDDVVGLLKAGTRNAALVVVYLAEDDFEGDDFAMEAYLAELEVDPA